MATDKVSKDSVNYRPAYSSNKRCGNCSMFIRTTYPTSCTLVRGRINSIDTCDRWEKKE